MSNHFESGHIHLTASEKDTMLRFFDLLTMSFRPNMNPDADAFVITDPVIIKADRQSFFDLNQIKLKLITQIKNNG